MLQVPPEYDGALQALLTLPTGTALLLTARTANVNAVISNGLNGAHGQTVNATTIHLRNPAGILSIPQQACIIAHELTHAHDLCFANLSAERYRDIHGLGNTEINAHINQGQVLREFRALRASFPNAIRVAIDAASAGVTVFGRSIHWATRADVVGYLEGTMYAGHVQGWRQNAALYSDDMYRSEARPFHCDENWHTFQRVLPEEDEGEIEEIEV